MNIDPVPADRLYPVFAATLGPLRDGGGMKTFEPLDGRLLIALNGTEYFNVNSG